jgi:hypothetical protein
MAEYSRIARGSFTTAASVLPQIVNLPFQPQRVKLLNYTAYSAPAQYSCTSANWDVAMGQSNTAFEYLTTTEADFTIAADYTTNGVSTFAGGLSLQYGPQLQISTTTTASSTITTASAHGLNTGDIVILEGMYQRATTGSPQVSNMPFKVTKTGTTTFTINWNMNQSNYTSLSGSPAGAYVRKVLYPFLYAPGDNFISAISTGTTTTVTTTAPHNFVVGQEIGFRIPSQWGTTQLNTLPNSSTPGSPLYYYVTSISSPTVFVCSANSTGFTAYNSNQTVASVPGLSLPQVFAMGDVNSGGVAYSGGALYPSPVVNGASTINGPAISGAFVNNTNQGFVIQNGAGAAQSSTSLLTASSLYIWEAFLYDMSM